MRAIGLDFGSVSTKGVLVDSAGAVEMSVCRRTGDGDRAALDEFLGEIARRHPGERFVAAVAGTHGDSARDNGERPRAVRAYGALAAIARGVRRDHPRARSIIEIGGHAAKFIVLDGSGDIRSFATNEACAAGTGSFLEQQAKRLAMTAEELAAIAVEAKSGATVAGRCSVFAKSDMIHLQQKGTSAPEIAYGLCLAIARNALATLLKGREADPPVVIAGGCAHSGGVVRAFGELLDLPASRVVKSASPGFEGAIGAALLAIEDVGETGERRTLCAAPGDELAAALREPGPGPGPGPGFPPLPTPPGNARAIEPAEIHTSSRIGYLGIDLGSVSTDLVVIDEDGELLSSVYLPTRGRPVDVLLEGLEVIRGRFPAGLTIRGTGTTGSGRHLAASLVGAETIRNEITCQVLGAQRFLPDTDTILEIGGQDSKFVSLKGGMIADFAMNKICAAGTGSFLEEQARELGISIVGDFASRAFRAGAPLELGTRCTVFMETEVVNSLRAGKSVDDICAGLALSIVRNYLDKVVGTRTLGDRIVFQGGVASNDAVVAAFESVLGKRLHVHPYNRISGAIGAALAARDAARAAKTGCAGPSIGAMREENDLAELIPHRPPSLRAFECALCANRCEVNVVKVDGRRAFFGDTCERYT
ncbi:MAG TPA: acyl-CoA dehydratase activase, partial [Thermoanaerobaculia bacterium]